MKKIEAIISSLALDDVTSALAREGLGGISVVAMLERAGRNVECCYRGNTYSVRKRSPRVKIELVASDKEAEPLASLVRTVATAAGMGEAKVWLTPIEGLSRTPRTENREVA